MIKLAGGVPVTTGSDANWEIPTEALIAADPEIIILGDAAYGVTAKTVAARPGWNVLTAVKDDAIRAVDDIVSRGRARGSSMDCSCSLGAIHPDAVLPSLAPVTP